MEAAQKRLRSQVEDEVQASAGPHNSLLDEAAVTGLGTACEEETAAANTPEALLDRAMKAFEVERLLHKRRMENYAKCKEGEKPKNRPDLEAMSNTGKKGQWINQRSRVGNVPGVPIGYRFFCRAAMKAAGVHGKHMSGIDFGRSSKPDGKKKDRPNLSVVDTTAFPHVPEGVEIAVAVMVSGHYEDDEDMLNSLWYTGAGGNDFQHSKLQTAHQKLHGPNKALCNNLKFSLPVRLFRRSEDKNSYTKALFTYDGLYAVKEHKQDVGKGGMKVHKFKLVRELGQATLVSSAVEFVRSSLSKNQRVADRKGLKCIDIAKGREKVPIPCVNTVDDEAAPIDEFEYITAYRLDSGVQPPPRRQDGCGCRDECRDTCACARLNGADWPVYTADGELIRAVDGTVVECGPQCPRTSKLRVVQRGVTKRLEVFRTKNKGWGLRCWDSICSGEFVCAYIGELISEADVGVRDDSYLFQIEMEAVRVQQDRMLSQGQMAVGAANATPASTSRTDEGSCQGNENVEENEDCKYVIDALKYANVGRFLNHSCNGNCFVQCVLHDHLDRDRPWITFFAGRNIPPLEELTYDYGYKLDSVMDSDGNVKFGPQCQCQSARCKGRLY
ncbi:hypothetical protein CYMTET_55265 [Cymbomonas tetramitiformis]|uniref:Uncharacterized protein n=1 Tax=Cymbomonas tetramitiformis TaxID=36881 RepID=A0AAE0BDM1_9CHLO|nr:hypothetical protein CYMTET_55265 [Cymbomonas tetramitiformis]